MKRLSLEPARSHLWVFPGEEIFESVARRRFDLTPEREAAFASTNRRTAAQSLLELLHGRDQVLNAYRILVCKLFRQWLPEVELGIETGAGACFFYRKVILEDPVLSEWFSNHWIQFEINEQLVNHTRKQFPGADIRRGDVYCLRLTAEEAARKKFALAVSSYDVLRFPGRAAGNHYALLNPGEFFILIQDVRPGGESILLAEQVRKCIEGDTSPLEYVTRMRPDGTRDVVEINYRGLRISTVDYYHTRICETLAATGFEIMAEGYATQVWAGQQQSQHHMNCSSPEPNRFRYDMGCRDYHWDPTIPAGKVKEELRVQIIVARKP